MTIWIVRRHPRMPYGTGGYLAAFTIFSTHATKAEAQEVVTKKMRNKNTNYLYTAGKVQLKEASK